MTLSNQAFRWLAAEEKKEIGRGLTHSRKASKKCARKRGAQPSAPERQQGDAHETNSCTDNFSSHFGYHIFLVGARDTRSADYIFAKGATWPAQFAGFEITRRTHRAFKCVIHSLAGNHLGSVPSGSHRTRSSSNVRKTARAARPPTPSGSKDRNLL